MDRLVPKISNESFQNCIRARKRHFDSRWRANIASCFETLLHVVPISKRAIKKQSKANILEATSQHLDFLENTIVFLLQEKAKMMEQEVVHNWCANEIERLKATFVEKETKKPWKSMKGRQRNRHTRVKSKIMKSSQKNEVNSKVEDEQPQKDLSDFLSTISKDYVKESLCCTEEYGTDDEGIHSASSMEVTPTTTIKSTSKAPKKIRKLPRPPKGQRSRRSLIEELNAIKSISNLPHSSQSNESDETVTVVDERLFLYKDMDPFLSNHLALHVDGERSRILNIEEALLDDGLLDQTEFIGQNSPLFGLEFEHILNNF